MFDKLLTHIGLKRKWRKFTEEEIALHNHKDSLWIVANNCVYDVTRFIQQHPGGAGALLNKGGGLVDCSVDVGFHSRKARAMWSEFQIGEVDLVIGRRIPSVKNCCSLVSSGTTTASTGGTSLSVGTPKVPEKCCCTRSAYEPYVTSPLQQHCAHCTCPDRPS